MGLNNLIQMEMTREELAQHESVIEQGLQTFVEVGAALLEIRDRNGYRLLGYSTFEQYHKERWKLGQSRVYQLMDAAEVIGNLKSSTMVELPTTERQARPLTQLEPELQREAWQKAVETAPNGKPTAAHVASVVEEIKGKGAHVAYNTGESEWYTPVEYINAARQVLGGIDLDPASCEIANETVQATRFYSVENDGLTKEWRGRVWMNPPYSAALVSQFAEKLATNAEQGCVTAAIALVNNATETRWFARLAEVASAFCFPTGRVRFLDPEGNPGAPLQGQAIIYIGKKPDLFIDNFQAFGWCARVP